MKIIDLLNKIANGEKVPSKIKFDNTGWYRKVGEKNVYYINDYDDDLFLHIFRKNLDFTLNDEVEVIEDKKIEKIYEDNDDFKNDKRLYRPTKNIKVLANKINEILDYLEEKENE